MSRTLRARRRWPGASRLAAVACLVATAFHPLLAQAHGPLPESANSPEDVAGSGCGRACEWSHLVASPAGALAVASESDVRISTDAGASFRSVLRRPEPVAAIAMTDDGTLYAARGQHLGRRAPGGQESWTLLPSEETDELVGNGAFVLWLGAVWWVSSDFGATFEPRPEWHVGNSGNWARLTATGRVRVLRQQEAQCGGGFQSLAAGLVSAQLLDAVGWPLDSVDNAPTTHGWSYDYHRDILEEMPHGLVAVSPRSHVTPLSVSLVGRDEYVLFAEDRNRVWILRGRELVSAIGTRAHVVSRRAPRKWRTLAVTPGTPWVLTEGGRLFAYANGRWQDRTPR